MYRLITENMTDLIAVFDLNRTMLYASPSHESVIGYPPIYLEGKNSLNEIPSDDQVIHSVLFEETVKNKQPCQFEFRISKGDDNWRIFEAVLTPILDEKGFVQYVVQVSREITEKRKAEELLWQSEKLSVVGELAAGVAHEIRNPLTSIKGFFQLLCQGVSKQEYFDVVNAEFNRIEDIINEFLTFAKPQAMELKNVEVKTLLKEVKTLLESKANLNNVQIFQEFDHNISKTLCDPNQIKLVFINLLKNSIEAMPKGGKITIKVCTEAKHLLVKIIDNGIGISEDRIQILGEPFFSNKEKGIGLGLTACFRILRQHNGTITFKSKESQGTTVEVRLPIHE